MRSNKKVIGLAVGLAASCLAAVALVPHGVDVETTRTVRGPLTVAVSGSGKARVKERYTVSAPVTGHVERIRLEPGDFVAAGDVLVEIAPAPLDVRTERELAGRLVAAQGAEAEARHALERAKIAETQAERERQRTLALRAADAISSRQHDAATFAWQASIEEARMAAETLRRARGELAATRALLAGSPTNGVRPAPILGTIRVPSAGHVLRVHHESEGIVTAGAPLVEVGDLRTLEASIELLSTQAVRVRPGARVELTQWGGNRPLHGRVTRIEPAAFTKVSALGIEEQRVNVIVEPVGGPEAWGVLGDGYRVEASIIIDERADALKVALGSLFRHGDDWAVFVVTGGRAELKTIRLGESDGAAAEVREGLAEGDAVVLHPSDKLADGSRVQENG